MKKHKRLAGALCVSGVLFIVVLASGTLASHRRAEPGRNNLSTQAPDGGLPEHIPYRIVFHQIYVLDREAEKAERGGRTASAISYRSWFKREAGLSGAQASILSEVAARCEGDVSQVDRRAKVILDTRRAYYPDGKLLPGQELLPPSEELMALQRERDATILRCRDSLRAALGEEEFARFDEFVARRVAPTITPGVPHGDAAARKEGVK